MPGHQRFPVILRRFSELATDRAEMPCSGRDVPNLVVKDSLQDARTSIIARGLHAVPRCRSDVKTARFEHHRHHGEPRRDVMPCLVRRLP